MDEQSDSSSVKILDDTNDSVLENIFARPVTTVRGSVIFAKQFTVFALSMIIHSRGVFPPFAFSQKTFKGFSIKVLSGKRVCFNAHLLMKWMKSAFKALEKGYLKELIFEILDFENHILEYYSIAYEYIDDQVSGNVSVGNYKIGDFDATCFENSIAELMSSISQHIQKLADLPLLYKLQLRIFYHNERTPETYTPDFFRDSNLEEYPYASKASNFLSKVQSPHINLSLHIVSNITEERAFQVQDSHTNSTFLASKRTSLAIDDNKKSENNQEINSSSHFSLTKKFKPSVDGSKFLIDSEHTNADTPSSQTPKCLNPISEKCTPTENIAPILLQEDPPVISQTTPHAEEKPAKEQPPINQRHVRKPASKLSSQKDSSSKATPVNCICRLNFIKGGLFECNKCHEKHHLVCYRRRPTSINLSGKVSCAVCTEDDKKDECLDPELVSKKIPMKTKEDLVLYRQVLNKLQWFSKIDVNRLKDEFQISECRTLKIIKNLIKKNMITPAAGSDSYVVQKTQLNAFIKSYFR